jgi:trk system potassium uptake protein TrkH
MAPIFCLSGLAPGDALLESVSAITTTGLSTLTNVEARPPLILFLRSWLQWLGGLGFVVLSVALLAGSSMVLRQLEITDPGDFDLAASTRVHARRSLLVYVGLTAATFAGSWASGLGPFEALLHTFSALSTGGFSTRSESFAAFGWAPQLVISAGSLAGAVSLALWDRLRRRGVDALLQDVELRALFAASLVLTLGLVAVLWQVQGLALREALQHGAFLAVSAQTTTGFSTMQVGELVSAAKLLLMLGMLTGGSAGSTAGGVKLLRVLVVIAVVRWIVLRVRMPGHAVAEPRLGGNR